MQYTVEKMNDPEFERLMGPRWLVWQISKYSSKLLINGYKTRKEAMEVKKALVEGSRVITQMDRYQVL